MKEKICIGNNIEELPKLAMKVEELGDKWELPMPLVMNLNLVLEEAITNIIFYGYTDKEVHDIMIQFEKEQAEMTIQIIDDAQPFDPTKKDHPDVNLSIEEREVGGLGIFLIYKIMDTVEYKRENNKNILTLYKSI